MVRCECHCVCCDTQVFILPEMAAEGDLHCPGCGRVLTPARIQPFGEKDWLGCRDPRILLQHRHLGVQLQRDLAGLDRLEEHRPHGVQDGTAAVGAPVVATLAIEFVA